MVDRHELEDRFRYHPPANGEVVESHQWVRANCLTLASTLNDVLPESREKSLALTAVQEAMMWANAAIAIHGNKEGGERHGEEGNAKG